MVRNSLRPDEILELLAGAPAEIAAAAKALTTAATKAAPRLGSGPWSSSWPTSGRARTSGAGRWRRWPGGSRGPCAP
jgi:hypothetical protein